MNDRVEVLDPADDDTYDFVVRVAAGDIAAVATIAEWLRAVARER